MNNTKKFLVILCALISVLGISIFTLADESKEIRMTPHASTQPLIDQRVTAETDYAIFALG